MSETNAPRPSQKPKMLSQNTHNNNVGRAAAGWEMPVTGILIALILIINEAVLIEAAMRTRLPSVY